MRFLQVLILMFGMSVFANAQKATLSGKVYDAYGAVIIKASVIAINEKGERFEAATNDDGIYSLNLPFNQYNSKTDFRIAKYDILTKANGFQESIQKDFRFVTSYTGIMSLDIALDVQTIVD